MKKIKEKPAEKVWADFAQVEKITEEQLDKFKKYESLLVETNKNINLTAVTNLSAIVKQHFMDSLALRNFLDLSKVKILVDVGTGAGLPSIPLKIVYPELKMILIEVNHKKQQFLQTVIDVLGLSDIEICGLDWRTFLRNTESQADLFVSKAAMDEVELLRLYRSNCPYKDAKLVYWVTDEWAVNPKVANFLKELKLYKIGKKGRKLAFFENE